MKIKTPIWFLVSLFWLLAADIAFSGETDPESKPHPILGSRFLLGVGTFWPEKDFEIRVDGTGPGDQLDFEEGLRANNSEDTFSGNFVWRFGQKWTLQAQAWGVETKAGTVLAEDIEWGNFTFREGTFANAGIDLEILRMVLGRKIKSGPNYEFGLGIGLHWMEIDAFLEGEIQVNEGTTEFHRGTVEAEFPMPNLAGWYLYSWAPKWAVIARADWLSASVGDYSGGLWNAYAAVYWQTFEHLGFSVGYSNFVLDGEVKKSSWRGHVGNRQHGPRLSIYVNW